MSRLGYLGIGVLVFAGFLLFTAPAGILYRLVEQDAGKYLPDTVLTGIEGSVWDGRGDLYYRQLPVVRVSWNLAALPLITGAADINAEFQAAGLELRLTADADSTGGSISDVSGNISSEFLNPITVSYGLQLSGDIQVSHANLEFDPRWLTAANAELNWDGGIVHIETPEKVHTTRLPPVKGTVSMAGPNLVIDVVGNDENLMTITLKPDGWAVVAVAYAFADLAGLPLPGSDTTTDRSLPAITLEEKIL